MLALKALQSTANVLDWSIYNSLGDAMMFVEKRVSRYKYLWSSGTRSDVSPTQGRNGRHCGVKDERWKEYCGKERGEGYMKEEGEGEEEKKQHQERFLGCWV